MDWNQELFILIRNPYSIRETWKEVEIGLYKEERK